MDEPSPSNEYLHLLSKTSTFVSIDVVDSTTLKSGENEQDVIYTFLSYHKLIREDAYAHHGEVISIAGDGVMCRFERPDDAVASMQGILKRIPVFNKRLSRLSRPFALRVGIHTGQVMESQSLSAGQIISHTLDVAAKLQQSALPDQARLSQETVGFLKPGTLSLVRVGWDAKLQTTIYQYAGSLDTHVIQRSLPNPVKVLLVDDDLEELARMKKLLWSRHHDALPTYTIHQATLCTTAWKPHVILVSADLPWETGWEFLKELRTDQAAAGIPVILTSRRPTGQTVEKCFGLGGNGLLSKPADEQQISKKVDMVLREFYL